MKIIFKKWLLLSVVAVFLVFIADDEFQKVLINRIIDHCFGFSDFIFGTTFYVVLLDLLLMAIAGFLLLLLI
ncbi:MAG: hypothetical protein J7K96_11165 [Desulfobacteraceae bacterium]|nr:hypothetical protein [Desulfobacteraceae bacterium]